MPEVETTHELTVINMGFHADHNRFVGDDYIAPNGEIYLKKSAVTTWANGFRSENTNKVEQNESN